MNAGKLRLYWLLVLVVAGPHVVWGAEPLCATGFLLEPYTNTCAAVNDVRHLFLPPAAAAAAAKRTAAPNATNAVVTDEPPAPGSGFIGIHYLAGHYTVQRSAHLHTLMFVYPSGLDAGALPNWIYTPATNRVDQSTEVVGMYRSWSDVYGLLGVYARPCSIDYPCPNGSTSNSWQFYYPMTQLPCNISNDVDAGGHSQLVMHYAHHSDKLDNEDPAAWKNAVYLWNFCEAQWDLIWEHNYRQNKNDCGLLDCSWWGPTIELFGDVTYPEVTELGYKNSLFIYDDIRSELRAEDGAGYVDPESYALVPWLTLHLESNRGFGVGNSPRPNNMPVIEGQLALNILEDSTLTLATEFLTISDLDVIPDYHVAYALRVHDGDNYTWHERTITPRHDYFGELVIPVSVSDGGLESAVFNLSLNVAPVNDPPIITGQQALVTLERTSINITIADLHTHDPDSDPTTLVLTVQDATGYSKNGTTVTPLPGVVGDIIIPLTISDGWDNSNVFNLLLTVKADTIAPVITIRGASLIRLLVGTDYNDDGATATDNLDGDISPQVVSTSNVDTSLPGSYSVTYTVTDQAGNAATPAVRSVVVEAPAPLTDQDSAAASGKHDQRCFIATAAYGSPLEKHVVALRSFRDKFLLTHGWGRQLVDFYYTHSPSAAAIISQHPALKTVTRFMLSPIIYCILHLRVTAELLGIFIVTSLCFYHRSKYRKNNSRFPR